MNHDDVLVNLIGLNGTQIDRERILWETYLLSRCGADLGFTFVYRNGGPYSTEFAAAWEDAQTDSRISVKEERTPHGTPYVVYGRNEGYRVTDTLFGLSAETIRSWLEKMANVPSLVLELAAAYVFLKDEEHYGDRTINELQIRKPLTTRGGRTQQALDLLRELGLEPPQPRN